MLDIFHQKPLLGRQINWAHPLARGLVACWLFNEGSGNKVYDIASHKYDLDFINNPIWSPGKFGHSILLDDGDSEHLGFSGQIITDYPFALAAWFNTDNNTDRQHIISFGDASANVEFAALEIENDAGDDVVHCEIRQIDATTSVSTLTEFSLNTWHFALVNFISTSNRNIFLDAGGKATNTASENFPSLYDLVSIGSLNRLTPIRYFSGKIDLPMIWNRTLTDNEVEWLFREPTAMFQQNRARWFSIAAPPVGDGQAFRLRAIEKY